MANPDGATLPRGLPAIFERHPGGITEEVDFVDERTMRKSSVILPRDAAFNDLKEQARALFG